MWNFAERFNRKSINTFISHGDESDSCCRSEVLAELGREIETEKAELRNDVKMGHFKNAQLTLSYEEKVGALRQAQLESDMHAKQLQAVQQSYMELEANKAAEEAKLRAQLEAERVKVQTYVQLEIDLDSAIVQAAGARGGVGREGSHRTWASWRRRRRRAGRGAR